jgi:hypothetical protein
VVDDAIENEVCVRQVTLAATASVRVNKQYVSGHAIVHHNSCIKHVKPSTRQHASLERIGMQALNASACKP